MTPNPERKRRLRALHTLAWYVKTRDDWTWGEAIWGEVAGLPHGRFRIFLEVDHAAFYGLDSELEGREATALLTETHSSARRSSC